MKIAIAQIKPLKGEVHKNIKKHLKFIEKSIELNVDLIIFPELSITSYEPILAKELATHKEDSLFNPFQKLSDKYGISIGIGMPIKSKNGIHISMLIFQVSKEVSVYSKQILHNDELPFFICGQEPTFLHLKGNKIALGICYETLQSQHFINAHQKGANIYIASVAKPIEGIQKAYAHFPKMAKEFKTPILMSNAVGFCDNFMSVGQSSVWDEKGNLLNQLDDKNEGILIHDTVSNQVATIQILS